MFLSGNFNLRLSNSIDKQNKLKSMLDELVVCDAENRDSRHLIRDVLVYD